MNKPDANVLALRRAVGAVVALFPGDWGGRIVIHVASNGGIKIEVAEFTAMRRDDPTRRFT